MLDVSGWPAEKHRVVADVVRPGEVEDHALLVCNAAVPDVRAEPRDRVDGCPHEAERKAVLVGVDGVPGTRMGVLAKRDQVALAVVRGSPRAAGPHGGVGLTWTLVVLGLTHLSVLLDIGSFLCLQRARE